MHKLTMQEMMAVSGGTCYTTVPVYDAYNNIIGWQVVATPCTPPGGGCWQDAYNQIHC